MGLSGKECGMISDVRQGHRMGDMGTDVLYMVDSEIGLVSNAPQSIKLLRNQGKSRQSGNKQRGQVREERLGWGLQA